ncbi:protein CREG1-like isoform X2 [Cimex lectularius]|uniref:CREG-like beta-barrel domain-containing protein n=1 Tax=Cimex lectularius TaxID=79782 RepID=A0A8I6RKZ6_CIMLE|nr:protein CREG1-like isoform X2 [Cimex lectularius]
MLFNVLIFAVTAANLANGKSCLEAIVTEKKSTILASAHQPPRPPPVDEIARMARYVVHYSEWTTLSHISHQKKENISGLAMGRVYSIADGPYGNSTGVPYIYVSLFDGVPRDLKIDNKCSMTISLAQGNLCASRGQIAEDPRCPQVILFGNFVFLDKDTDEWNFAENALFSRYPMMRHWPKFHNFLFGKLDINKIILVDNFGGSKYPNIKDYFNSPPQKYVEVVRAELFFNESSVQV